MLPYEFVARFLILRTLIPRDSCVRIRILRVPPRGVPLSALKGVVDLCGQQKKIIKARAAAHEQGPTEAYHVDLYPTDADAVADGG